MRGSVCQIRRKAKKRADTTKESALFRKRYAYRNQACWLVM
jgi:hypothetical protein